MRLTGMRMMPTSICTRLCGLCGTTGECGSWRARRLPVVLMVVGSPAVPGRWLTRGRIAKHGLPRATVRPPRCGSGGKLACHEYENSNGTGHILHIKRRLGTETKIITTAFCPGLSPSQSQGSLRC